jgi:hypothetical protein
MHVTQRGHGVISRQRVHLPVDLYVFWLVSACHAVTCWRPQGLARGHSTLWFRTPSLALCAVVAAGHPHAAVGWHSGQQPSGDGSATPDDLSRSGRRVAGVPGYAVYRSSKRTSLRPRQQYFLFCAGYLVVGIVSLAFGGWADSRHIGWISNAMVWSAGLSLAGVLVMFGRGAFRGRLRALVLADSAAMASSGPGGSNVGAASKFAATTPRFQCAVADDRARGHG